MSSTTLQQRLAAYLKQYPGERIAKGHLEDLARKHMGVTAETVGRRLRVLHEATCVIGAATKTSEHESAFKLAEGGRFLVEYRGKNHSFYYYEPPKTKTVREWKMVDGRMKEIIITVSV
jgi:hypothetical protein